MTHELENIITAEMDKLYRFAYNRLRDEYKAEDAVQDIVLTAYRAYPRLMDKERTIPWLWGIARNIVLRAFKPSPEIPMDEITIIDMAGISYETPESEIMRKEDITKIRRAVAYLAKNYRDVCVLHYLENKDYHSIAKELNIPLSSVKWRLNQTKIHLKKELEKMEYMEHGYRKAVPLTFNFGGWVGKMTPKNGNYDGADKALGTLLAQNICLCAYEKAKTVTEIASDLGVAADYIEETLEKLTKTQCVRQVANKYQTMFPIWDKAANEDIYLGNLRLAEEMAKDILDDIYSLAEKARDIEFCGSQKETEKLILFLIGFICDNTERNIFPADKVPFQGDDKGWYILATTDKCFLHHVGGCGINSCGSMFGLREYHFTFTCEDGDREINGLTFNTDTRSFRTEEQKAFYSLYLGEPVTDDYSLSKLIEQGKVAKDGEGYRITVPVISRERGEFTRMMEVFAPVFAKTNALQEKLLRRSEETLRKYIPAHISHQEEFFSGYCGHNVLENALFSALVSRGVTPTNDMATWYVVK